MSIRSRTSRTRFCLVPDDEGGAALAAEHLDRARPAAHRARHRAGAVRGRAAPARRLSQGARSARPRGAARTTISPARGRRTGAARRSRKLFAHAAGAPDAIFCGNDQIARGVADALRERGIAVPDAVSIVGFDNWEIVAAATRPPLTTIDMNLKELGREAGPQADRADRRQVRSAASAGCPAASSSANSCGAARPQAETKCSDDVDRQDDQEESRCANTRRSTSPTSASRAISGASGSTPC